MKRIEEFTMNGKNFMCIDFSEYRTDDDFLKLIAVIEPLIEKYPKDSLYTITNTEKIRFNARIKDIVVKFLEHNKPYVKHGVVFGFDGIKKVMINTVLKMSGRSNIHFSFSKEKAVEWLLAQD